MTKRPNLKARLREFADDLTSLLNATVTTGIRVPHVPLRKAHGLTGYVGYRLNSQGLRKAKPFQVGPFLMDVTYILELDPEGYLTVHDSRIRLGPEPGQPFVRYEYVRSNHPHPTAHFHIHGSSKALRQIHQAWSAPKGLEKLHFPVGGTRYRPTLEDIIEFLILERFVPNRPRAETAINKTRLKWQKQQLGAAARSDPKTAWEAVQKTAWWEDNRHMILRRMRK